MSPFAREEGGQTVVLFGLLLSVLLFSVGIAFDLGTMFVARRTLQEAADAAAFGGAIVLYNGGTGADAEAAASTDLVFNGYSLSDPLLSIVVHSPPQDGPYAGRPEYIEVAITQQVRTPLLPAEGGLSNVTVSSTAGKVRTPAGYALVALDPSSSSSFWLASSGTTTVNNGDVQVNSSSSTASMKTAGTFVLGSGVGARTVGGQTGFTNMLTGQPYVADPLAGYLRPSTTGLTDHGTVVVHATTALDPGLYKNINISCSSACTVTFNPGTYILLGSGLSAIGSTTLTGTGVFFFNTVQNYPTEQGSCGSISIAVDSDVTISAPTSGYYSGMLFFQDPSCTQTLGINANGSITSSNGSLYAPTATVQIAGSNTISIGGQIIAKKVWVASGASVTINYDPATVASPILPALVR